MSMTIIERIERLKGRATPSSAPTDAQIAAEALERVGYNLPLEERRRLAREQSHGAPIITRTRKR